MKYSDIHLLMLDSCQLSRSVDLDAIRANLTGLHLRDVKLPTADSGAGFTCEVGPGCVLQGTADGQIMPPTCPALTPPSYELN